jgi:hypothetical protein
MMIFGGALAIGESAADVLLACSEGG